METGRTDRELVVAGIGPGDAEGITVAARQAIRQAQVVVGYPLYLELVSGLIEEQECISTPMRQELERVHIAFAKTLEGRRTVLVCSGDAGIYGLASPVWEIAEAYPEVAVRVIPGVTAAASGAALLGAPLGNDFCVVSLSDYLTPWTVIEKRLLAAAEAELVLVLYNVGSKSRPEALRRACEVMASVVEPERLCGVVKNIGRMGQEWCILPFRDLKDAPADMTMTVYIGNRQTKRLRGQLVTPRGYSYGTAE